MRRPSARATSSSTASSCGPTNSALRTPPGPEGSNGTRERVWWALTYLGAGSHRGCARLRSLLGAVTSWGSACCSRPCPCSRSCRRRNATRARRSRLCLCSRSSPCSTLCRRWLEALREQERRPSRTSRGLLWSKQPQRGRLQQRARSARPTSPKILKTMGGKGPRGGEVRSSFQTPNISSALPL